jgi:hypothetical protein
MTDFLKLFKSPELWSIPIESFIEAYCLIFTPTNDADEDMDSEVRTAR